MDVEKILLELRAERDAVGEAIMTLERLAGGRGKRRGRPPKWIAEMGSRENGRAEAGHVHTQQEH